MNVRQRVTKLRCEAEPINTYMLFQNLKISNIFNVNQILKY